MKTRFLRVTAVLLLTSVSQGIAATRYVNVTNPGPVAPYTNWATAATSIQDAVDVALAGDLILVTNGVYQTGGRVAYGSLTNRVTLDKAVTVESVNGPEVTIIKGYQEPGTTNGPSAVRCVYMDAGSALIGFTVTNGATFGTWGSSTEQRGGGIFVVYSGMISNVFYTGTVSNCVIGGSSAGVSGGTLFNCVIIGNTSVGAMESALVDCVVAENLGSGAYISTLTNCVIRDNISEKYGGGTYASTAQGCLYWGNSARFEGGGAFWGTLDNCTVIGNTANVGGGVHSATVRNSVLYHNTAVQGENYFGGTIAYSCATPLPTNGTNNFDAEPQLASLSHLSLTSPCRQSGSAAFAAGWDIDHDSWIIPPSIGCDEYHSGSVTGSLSASVRAAYTNVSTGFKLNVWAEISGRVSLSVWDFGDGTVVSNRPYVAHSWATPGNYPVVLRAYNESYPGGILASSVVHVVEQPIHHVMADSANPVPPYTSWATAASNIQDAVDVALIPGALVLVTNGFYASGGRAVFGAMTNRVVVTNCITVRSVNGPEATMIVGQQIAGTTNGDSAVRCVYLSDRATINGFTITNGATRNSGDEERERSGGGLWCYNSAAVVSNCVISGNSAHAYGGGSAFGTLLSCTVAANTAQDGGAADRAYLTNCTITANVAAGDAGGAFRSTSVDCTFAHNSADTGGAASSSTLINCTITTNSADTGGGAFFSRLFGCVLTGNTALYEGGGTHSGAVSNSIISGNFAMDGGGAYNTELRNSAVTGNSAVRSGGGVYRGSQVNCTITGNAAGVSGGGAYDSGGLYSSIIYFNTAKSASNYFGRTLNYCCTTPLPASGNGNITNDPALASAFHLSAASPCQGAGLANATGQDIDREVWRVPPSIGCDERHAGSITGELGVTIYTVHTLVATGFAANVSAQITGHASASYWDFGDGTIVSNRPFATHSWASVGIYPVVLTAFNESNPTGITATQMVQVVEGVYYVSAANPQPQFPYLTWASAATNIQDAVDAATVPGASVLVSNGIYASGGRTVGTNTLMNRVVVDKPIPIRSVNGPQLTSIQGLRVPGTTNGPTAIRCVYLASGASLSGFTLTNGATRVDGDVAFNRGGGGLFCEDFSAMASNCVIVFNSASANGGGAYLGVLTNCSLTANTALSSFGGAAYRTELNNCIVTSNTATSGGGAYNSKLDGCTLSGNRAASVGGGAYTATLTGCSLMSNWAGNSGGAAYGGALNRCVLKGNRAVWGGGTYGGTLNNCVLLWNSASTQGGGANASHLTNCTVTANSATGDGGGTAFGTQYNSILYANLAPTGSNYVNSGLDYCCTTPLPFSGSGNFTNPPLFVDLLGGDLHLQPTSPCINSGRNAYVANSFDLDNNPRIAGGTVDIGAYELQSPSSILSYAWAQRYGLPTDGSTDFADTDVDGMNNYGEWRSDTIPTNALSVLRMLSATNTPTGANVTWQSVATRSYWLERATNLGVATPFQTVATNIAGVVGTKTFTDTSATNGGPYFYRVGVQ